MNPNYYPPETAYQVTRLFSTSLTGVNVFSDQLIQAVKNGEVSALELRVWIKSVEMIIDRVNKETQENQVKEADKYPERKFEFAGASIEKAEFGKYDFTACGDPVYAKRLQISNEATEQLKERESFLKALKEPITILDEGSGEVITITPPTKPSTSGLKISIK